MCKGFGSAGCGHQVPNARSQEAWRTIMTETITANEVVGAKLIDGQGAKVGTIGQLYLDDQTRQPEWVTVNTGLFGTKESFVPVADAHYDGESLQVPYGKDEIKDAPTVDPEGAHLTEAEES